MYTLFFPCFEYACWDHLFKFACVLFDSILPCMYMYQYMFFGLCIFFLSHGLHIFFMNFVGTACDFALFIILASVRLLRIFQLPLTSSLSYVEIHCQYA